MDEQTEREREMESRFSPLHTHMPIMRAREDKEGKRGESVRVGLLCCGDHTGAQGLCVLFKNSIFLAHSLSEQSLPTDSLSLTPNHSHGAPAIWPRSKNDDITRERRAGGRLDSCLQKSAITFHKQPPLWKLKVYPSSKFPCSVFSRWLLWINLQKEVVVFPGSTT